MRRLVTRQNVAEVEAKLAHEALGGEAEPAGQAIAGAREVAVDGDGQAAERRGGVGVQRGVDGVVDRGAPRRLVGPVAKGEGRRVRPKPRQRRERTLVRAAWTVDGRRMNGVEESDGDNLVLGDLAVCEPLSRQYLLLPRIPEYLLTSVDIKEGNIDDFRASLVPSGDWEETSFKVLCTIHSRERLAVCVFSSTSGSWTVDASTSWDVLSLPPRKLELGWAGRWPQFAYGCCYWKLRDQNELLKLEMNTLEFSIVDFPPNHIMLQNMGGVAIVEAGEGIVGMLIQTINPQIRGTSMMYYTSVQNGNGANEWDLKNTTPMPDYFYGFVGSAGGYIFLPRGPPLHPHDTARSGQPDPAQVLWKQHVVRHTCGLVLLKQQLQRPHTGLEPVAFTAAAGSLSGLGSSSTNAAAPVSTPAPSVAPAATRQHTGDPSVVVPAAPGIGTITFPAAGACTGAMSGT
ncbi:hypothetical protein HU200_051525 [Digitaria exilis]|uniref:Uncharacterized protein n=1 Tax=Digitaria exilis TaxID=1010633 RepID=A0A835EA56_9POAL|nr:hypothetical protein HU200_051525 [Digitaria exilis]